MDLFPTLARAAGIKLPDTFKFDGADLWDSILKDQEANRPDFVMGNWDIAVYRPPWKLIIPAVQDKPQLFDVVEDPYEKKHVIRENLEITQTLKK